MLPSLLPNADFFDCVHKTYAWITMNLFTTTRLEVKNDFFRFTAVAARISRISVRWEAILAETRDINIDSTRSGGHRPHPGPLDVFDIQPSWNKRQ